MNMLAQLSFQLDFSNPYILIISASIILILSSVFSTISSKTNIPSVLMLIILGIIIQVSFSPNRDDLHQTLEILGIIGLIMIVLEAALDLKLDRSKLGIIGKSLFVAFAGLLFTAFLIAGLFQYAYQMPFLQALLYATPLAVMSSAIIIPSVTNLVVQKKEFMIYESTFSDVLGIMLFYFILSFMHSGGRTAAIEFGGSLILTLIVAVISCYILVFIFKDFKQNARLFLLIAILLLLYSGGKLFHLSPLLIILIFGMSLSNHKRVFRIFKNEWIDEDPIEKIEKEFHLITLETAFVVRTFFFVIFGMTILLNTLLDLRVLVLSLAALIVLYLVRFIVLRLSAPGNLFPELYIAPRGLITVLLFFAIPAEHHFEGFHSGILLFVIIISSILMTYGLIRSGRDSKPVQPAEGD